MRKLRFLVLLLAILTAPASLMAAHQADLYIIPVASHITGVNRTTWMSDIAIQNIQPSGLALDFLFIRSGQVTNQNVFNLVSTAIPTGSTTVPPLGSVLLKDVLSGFEGATDGLLGAIIVSGDKPFAITSRAYGVAPNGDTMGQTVVPVRDFIDNTLRDTNNDMANAYLPGLVNNGSFRTNVGFVAGAGSTRMQVEITFRGADGAPVGARSISIPANEFAHVQLSAAGIANVFDIGSATVSILAGDGAVAPYASVIDNRTADAVYINAVFPANAPFAKTTEQPSLFRALAQRMKLR